MQTVDNKILLILDLDETLIHTSFFPLKNKYDFMLAEKYFVHKRPHLETFLQTCYQYFRLAVWSAGTDDYVREIVDEIFPENIELEFVWGRNKCSTSINYSIDYYSNGLSTYTKQFRRLKKAGYNLNRILIVDDKPHVVANSYGNAIYVNEFNGDATDNELDLLLPYLISLKDIENVRTVEKRGWRNETSIYVK